MPVLRLLPGATLGAPLLTRRTPPLLPAERGSTLTPPPVSF